MGISVSWPHVILLIRTQNYNPSTGTPFSRAPALWLRHLMPYIRCHYHIYWKYTCEPALAPKRIPSIMTFSTVVKDIRWTLSVFAVKKQIILAATVDTDRLSHWRPHNVCQCWPQLLELHGDYTTLTSTKSKLLHSTELEPLKPCLGEGLFSLK